MTDLRLKNKNWRINHLYFIKDKNKRLIQFKPNKTQRHFCQHVHSRNIILKSRQLGFTTLETIEMLDEALFTRNYDGLLIAQDLDSAKDIFDNKVYLAWENFGKDGRLKRLYQVDMSSARRLKVGFGDNTYSSLAVDSSGRSGTFARLHITEFAQVALKRPDKADEIITGSIPAVPISGRVDIESTAQGRGMFYDLFWQAWTRPKTIKLQPTQFKSHFYNWQWDEETLNKIEVLNPQSLSAEFRKYQAKFNLTDREITYYFLAWEALGQDWEALKREYPTTVEEAFEAAVRGAYYAEELGLARREGRVTKIDYDNSLPVFTVWDLGVSDATAIGFFQKVNQEVRFIDYYESSDKGLPHYLQLLQNRKYVYARHIAPHDISVREFTTGRTRLEIAQKLGIRFDVLPSLGISDGINAGRQMFSRLWVDERKCQRWLDYIAQYHREWDDVRGMFKDNPFHDFTSHAADMYRYAALAENMFTGSQGALLVDDDLGISPRPAVEIKKDGYVTEEDMLWHGREPKRDWRYQ